jgi:hypothetical protein
VEKLAKEGIGDYINQIKDKPDSSGTKKEVVEAP